LAEYLLPRTKFWGCPKASDWPCSGAMSEGKTSVASGCNRSLGHVFSE
jgi:hypothetical protein